LRRFHLFEIHDQPWCPKIVRDGLTDYLSQSETDRQTYTPVLPLIVASANQASASQVIDLCSGGGGPWIHWLASGASPSIRCVILTDKFPNTKSAGKQLPAGLEYSQQSVDATAVPPALKGFRTLFTSFHHFSPEPAQAILRDASGQRQPIGIFEFTHRGVPALLIMLLSIVSVWITVPRIRPVKLSTLLLTYLLPVIPFVVMFDGVVSCLRTYTPEELLAMAKKSGSANFEWKSGLIREGTTPGLPITYLIGLPSA
jgi:hypothetical protein